MRLATFRCNPACQCQERRSITHALLRASTLGQIGLQTRIAGTSHLIGHCLRSADSDGDSALLRFFFSFFKLLFWVKPSSRYSLVHFCRPHLPKVFGPLSAVNMLKFKLRSRHNRVHFLLTNFPERLATAETETLHQRPQGSITRKNAGFALGECFHP